MTSVLFLLAFIIPALSTKPRDCFYTSPKKAIGDFDSQPGTLNDTFYSNNITESELQCKNICFSDDNCSAFSYINRQCILYDTANNLVRDYVNRVFIWTACDLTEYDDNDHRRCKGNFIGYVGKRCINTQYEIVGYDYLDKWKCQKFCLANPLCGYINYNSNTSGCTLIQKWPAENIKTNQTTPNFIMYNWTCINGYENYLLKPRETYKPISMKCTGFWIITNLREKISTKNRKGVFFNTMMYEYCLKECDSRENCHEAFFNFNLSFCILFDVETISLPPLSAETTFIQFNWKCVKNDSQPESETVKEEFYVKNKMACVKLTDNSDLFIAHSKCDKIPDGNRFVSCGDNKTNTGLNYALFDFCLLNQSFWTFPTKPVNMTVKGRILRRATKIFTGLTDFWLVHDEREHFVTVDFTLCRVFDGSSNGEGIALEFISKQQWYAAPPIRYLTPFSMKPRKVVITAAESFSCRTRNACISAMRKLQVYFFNEYFDVPFNFLIDESGKVFVGRGWKLQSATVLQHNVDTIAIAYLGNVVDRFPTVAFLKSAKRLIEFAVENDYLIKDYSLFIQQDLGRSRINRGLEIVIKLWDRYKGFHPDRCWTISNATILSNCFVLLFLCFIPFMYKIFCFTKHCRKCQILKDFSMEQCPLIKYSFNGSLELSIKGISTRFSKCVLISEKPQDRQADSIRHLIKIWMFNCFLKSCNSFCHCNGLTTFLSHMVKPCVKFDIYQFSETCKKGEKPMVTMLVIFGDNSFSFFKMLVKEKKCICHYFNLEHVDFSDCNIRFK